MEAFSYAAAATAAFALLFCVPLAVSAALRTVEAAFGDRTAGPGRSEALADAKFAAGWSLLGFLPVGLLLHLADPSGSYSLWALAAIAIAGFGLAFRASASDSDPLALRLAWAALEALLLVAGFWLFIFTHDLCQALGEMPA